MEPESNQGGDFNEGETDNTVNLGSMESKTPARSTTRSRKATQEQNGLNKRQLAELWRQVYIYEDEGLVWNCAHAEENPSAVQYMLVMTSPNNQVNSSEGGKTIHISANNEAAMQSP